MDDLTKKALAIGLEQAQQVLSFRAEKLELRAQALNAHPGPLYMKTQVSDCRGGWRGRS